MRTLHLKQRYLNNIIITYYAIHSLQAPPYKVSGKRAEKYYSVQGKPYDGEKPTQAYWEENPGPIWPSTDCLSALRDLSLSQALTSKKLDAPDAKYVSFLLSYIFSLFI